jgi:hypothetical protein
MPDLLTPKKFPTHPNVPQKVPRSLTPSVYPKYNHQKVTAYYKKNLL